MSKLQQAAENIERSLQQHDAVQAMFWYKRYQRLCKAIVLTILKCH